MLAELGIIGLNPIFEIIRDAAYFLFIGVVLSADRIDAHLADVDLYGDVIDESEVFADDGVVIDNPFLAEEVEEVEYGRNDSLGAIDISLMHEFRDARVDELGAFLNVKCGFVDVDGVAFVIFIVNDHFFVEVVRVIDVNVDKARLIFEFEVGGLAGVERRLAFFLLEEEFAVVGVEREGDVGEPAARAQFRLFEKFEDILVVFRTEDVRLGPFAQVSELLT